MREYSREISRKNASMQTGFTRFMLIVAFFILWIGAIGVRLVHLQVNQSDWLREKALDQRRDQIKSKTLRGTIFDRSGRVLAMSVKSKSLFADPAEIDDVAATAKKVAAALKVNPNEILNNLSEAKKSGKRFVWLARKIDEDTVLKLNEALREPELRKFDEPRLAGLHWREEHQRSYPYGALASQVVGFSGADDIGQAGIELSQEENLRGATVKTWQDRDRLGRVYDESEGVREPPKDVVLTISHSIQYKAEEALEAGVKAAQAKSGIAVVLDPKTGEILAMANYPTFNPNNASAFPAENYKNKAVQNSYAPGSIFKLVTYGAALNERLIKPEEQFSCGNGFIEVGNHKFTDSHCGKALSFTKAFAISSNIGAIKTGMKVGRDKFSDYIRLFGFGEETGIEVPAEMRGLVRPKEKWQGDSLASMSIGYEIGVTALQTASSFATIANDGIRVRPHIIKEIRAADGEVISITTPQQIPVVSPQAAQNLRRMMREVVVQGTGKEAALRGYTSAGKTGTAWKYDPKTKRVSGSKYVSSFVGFAPAENPTVVIAVILDEPQGALRNGGQVSAPIFREIAEQVLPELGISPDIGIESTENEIGENAAAQEEPVEPDARIISKITSNVEASIKTPESKMPESKPPEKNVKKPLEAAAIKSEKEKLQASKTPKDVKPESNKSLIEEKDRAKPKTAPDKKITKSNIKNKSSNERIRVVN
jgi:cell division protein FtsI (penicillin-binding protein 3)